MNTKERIKQLKKEAAELGYVLVKDEDMKVRKLRAQAAMIGHVINSQEFYDAAAASVRKMSTLIGKEIEQ